MSGPLSTVLDGISRLTERRAEARVQAQLRRLGQNLEFKGLAHQPPVQTWGDFNAARAVLKGQLKIGAYVQDLSDLTPWEADLPAPALRQVLHRFDWLDDMAALGTKAARARAQGWVLGWLDRYGSGTGPGWIPETGGLRAMRMLIHLPFLEKGMEEEASHRILAALAIHTAWLAEVARTEEDTRGRIVALSALLHCASGLNGFEEVLRDTTRVLAQTCADRVSEQGGIASRNPEDLLAVFQHLLWVRDLLEELDRDVPVELKAVIARIAPTLRGLRLGDGGLARFHGGGAGAEGALDHALADSGERARAGDMPCMGFARLQGGRVGIVVDCARPPERSDKSHASTLAFEMSSGRRPVIVNVGPTIGYLPDWTRAPRTTSAHSALALDKTSSSRMAPSRMAGKPGMDALQTRPGMVTLSRDHDATGMWMQARHDGYLADYGLLHERRVFLSARGDQIHGEDVLLAPDQKAQRRFASRIRGAAKLGVALSVHFHLHPDVEAQIDRSEEIINLTLKSGEHWVFSQTGGLLDLESSAYIADAFAEPVPTRQIVIRARATSHSAEIGWSLVRKGDKARATRDVGIDPTGH